MTTTNNRFTPCERVAAMQASSTLAVLQAADALRRAGHEVIDLGAGEPDFPTPDNIKQVAYRAIEENFTRYTPAAGTLEIKQAIIDYFLQETGTRYEPQEVVVSAGGKQSIFNAIITLINPGDEVLIAAPYWVTFPEIVIYAGGQPVIIDTEPNAFQLTAEMVAEHITPKSRLLIINSPSNPSGRVIAPAEFERIVKLAVQRGLWVLSDECYYQFTYPPHQPFSAASLAPELRARTLVSGSFSKTYAMTGWRVGYALAPREWIAEMVKVQSHSTSNPSSIAQKAAVEAASGSQESVAVMLAEYQRRRNYLVPALNAIPGIECIEPEGAFYAFPSIKNVLAANTEIKTSQALAQHLLERAHVVLTAGSAFGSEGYLRISYATSLATLQRGVERITGCIKQLLKQ
ncbi:MAG: pyridoxal phosphate-dependent aminotransferase [Acidobacteriota bacterium]